MMKQPDMAWVYKMFEAVHEILVHITYENSKGLAEPVQSNQSFAACTYKVGA